MFMLSLIQLSGVDCHLFHHEIVHNNIFVCHSGLSYDTVDILLSIAGNKCCGVDVSIHVSVASVAVYATQCCLSIAVKLRSDAQRYLKY